MLAKIFSKLGLVKEAYDWFTFANEAATAMGWIKRSAAAAATVAVVAAPVAVYNNGGFSGVSKVLKVEDEKTKVYFVDYLAQPENKELLDRILLECKTDPEVVVDRCIQASEARARIKRKKFFGKPVGGF